MTNDFHFAGRDKTRDQITVRFLGCRSAKAILVEILTELIPVFNLK
jgi:hypothetical protein